MHIARAHLCSSPFSPHLGRDKSIEQGVSDAHKHAHLKVSATEAQHFVPHIIQDGTMGEEGRLGWRACIAPFLGLEKRFSRESPTPTTTRSATSARIGTNWSANWFRNTSLRAYAVMHQGTAQAVRRACEPRDGIVKRRYEVVRKTSGTPAFATRPAYVRGGAG